MAFLLAATNPSPPQPATVCELAAHAQRYLGKHVQVVGDLADIEPHGVVLTAGSNSHCVLEVGSVSGGTSTDVLSIIHNAPHKGPAIIAMVAHVRITGVMRKQRITDFNGRPLDAYVLDEMAITYRSNSP